MAGRDHRCAGLRAAPKALWKAIPTSVLSSRCRSARAPRDSLALLRKLWRAYDLAISTQSGDRPTLFAWAAGRQSVGFVEAQGTMARVKWLALGFPVAVAGGLHRVNDVLRLAEAIGISPLPEVIAPRGPLRSGIAPDRPYAVIHAAPMFRYKRWTADGWQVLAAGLDARGLTVIATGGPDDRPYLDEVWSGQPEVRRVDVLPWPELAALIAGAQVYVGPDTSVTHLAAATGTPTIALYGPTDPRLWGPWPVARPRPAMGGRRNHPEPGQCLAHPEPSVLPLVDPAVPAGGVRAAPEQPQPLPRRTGCFASAFRRGCGARRRPSGCRPRQWRLGANAGIEEPNVQNPDPHAAPVPHRRA